MSSVGMLKKTLLGINTNAVSMVKQNTETTILATKMTTLKRHVSYSALFIATPLLLLGSLFYYLFICNDTPQKPLFENCQLEQAITPFGNLVHI